MSDGWKAFWVWTLVVVLAVAFLGNLASKDLVHTGNELNFDVRRDRISIDAKTVTFSAASSEFFVLRNANSGAVIYGELSPRPLGWEHDSYYTFGPQEISGGNWDLKEGNPTVYISSEDVIDVREPGKFSDALLITIFGFLIWLVVIALANSNDFN